METHMIYEWFTKEIRTYIFLRFWNDSKSPIWSSKSSFMFIIRNIRHKIIIQTHILKKISNIWQVRIKMIEKQTFLWEKMFPLSLHNYFKSFVQNQVWHVREGLIRKLLYFWEKLCKSFDRGGRKTPLHNSI